MTQPHPNEGLEHDPGFAEEIVGILPPPPVHHVEMFTSSDFLTPGSTWGYQCFTCHETCEGFKTLASAEAAANQHQNDTEGLS